MALFAEPVDSSQNSKAACLAQNEGSIYKRTFFVLWLKQINWNLHAVWSSYYVLIGWHLPILWSHLIPMELLVLEKYLINTVLIDV